jgi:hypothetical protein
VNFRVASSFTAALRRLTHAETKAVKTTAFDLQVDPSHPGLKFHRVERSRDPDFWTVRVNDDLRIVVHKRGADFLLAWVGHHDDAYTWAERRRIETHPTTGAAQIVEVRELVEDAPPPSAAAPVSQPARPRIFDGQDDAALLSYGVPPDWLADVRAVADEDALLDLAAHLPAEAAEALLALATGAVPAAPEPVAAAAADPFAHPDALRRFRLMETNAELEAALDAPWDAWTVFLHPSQRDFVERAFGGPARVTGSAGTGKTVVALHRAVHLARRDPSARILLATFTDTLAAALRIKLRRLLGAEEAVAARIAVRSMESLGRELHEARIGPVAIATEADIATALDRARSEHGALFTREFLLDEWTHVVDAWDIRDAETYATVPRLGRKTRVGGTQRAILWTVMADARADLDSRGLTTWSAAWSRIARFVAEDPPFTAAVIDESQDLSVAELRFLAALAAGGAELFFAGDIGQRIFRQPFSWLALGVDIRGRSRVLKVNYRTSHQIRSHADRLLPGVVADGDGTEENRHGVVSVFAGPPPETFEADSAEEEIAGVAAWLASRRAEGLLPSEIGVFARTDVTAERGERACAAASIPLRRGAPDPDDPSEAVTVCTMALAKGLEFRAVAVMACDEDVVPLAERLATASSEAELREIYETERHILYVACTRAREHLLVSGVNPVSEYLGDLMRRQ